MNKYEKWLNINAERIIHRMKGGPSWVSLSEIREHLKAIVPAIFESKSIEDQDKVFDLTQRLIDMTSGWKEGRLHLDVYLDPKLRMFMTGIICGATKENTISVNGIVEKLAKCLPYLSNSKGKYLSPVYPRVYHTLDDLCRDNVAIPYCDGYYSE